MITTAALILATSCANAAPLNAESNPAWVIRTHLMEGWTHSVSKTNVKTYDWACPGDGRYDITAEILQVDPSLFIGRILVNGREIAKGTTVNDRSLGVIRAELVQLRKGDKVEFTLAGTEDTDKKVNLDSFVVRRHDVIRSKCLSAPDAYHALDRRTHQGIPSIAVSKGGRLWATWYANVDGCETCENFAVLTTSADGGRTWKEVLIADPDLTGLKRAFDPEIWVTPDNRVLWTWSERVAGIYAKGLQMWSGCSADPSSDTIYGVYLDAEKEPDPAALPEPFEITKGVMMCKPIVRRDGSWLLPVAHWYDEPSSLFYESRDNGKSFHYLGGATVPVKARTYDEQNVVELDDGTLKTWIRTAGHHKIPGMMESVSKDGGKTWSLAERAKVPHCSSRAFVTKLPNGHLVMVKNGHREVFTDRERLTAMVSRDGGETWEGDLVIDGRRGPSYPDGCVMPDGSVLVIYDCDRQNRKQILISRFTEAEVLAGGKAEHQVISASEPLPETAKWQAKLDAVAAAGGGRVVVPAGVHWVGSLRLGSNTTLELAKGAVLKGSCDIGEYADIHIKYAEIREPWQGLVWAEDAENVAVVGEGTIDGNGKAFPYDTRLGRPRGLLFHRCRNVRVEGVKLYELASWTCYFKECDGVVFRRVTVDSHANGNNDGVDIDARNVLVEDCRFDCDDDGIVLKSDDADFIVENVEVRNCEVRSCCSLLKLGTASHGGFRNIRFRNITGGAATRETCDPKTGKALISEYRAECWPGATTKPAPISAVAVECVDGGLLEDVEFRDLDFDVATTPIFIRGGLRYGRKWGNKVDLGLPFGHHRVLRNVLIENLKVRAVSYTASSITGLPDMRLSGITLRNIDIEVPGAGEEGKAELGRPVPEKADAYPESNMFDHRMLPAYGLYIRHADDVKLENVRFTVKGREFRPEILNADARRPVRFGVAYYPEAWPEERWAQDLDDMKAIGIDLIRVGEFNWTGFEPREGEFDFAPYRRLLKLCEEKGVGVMMCTPTAALPPWMTAKYAVEREDRNGHGVAIGCRQTRCPSREKFRFFADRMATKMAEAFRDFKCIRYWQLDNEVHITAGYDECCCKECEKKFQTWLGTRYGTVEAMNRAWNHAFWSGRFNDFTEVRLPIHKGRPWFLEYIRFQSENFKDFILDQAAVIRKVIPGAVITSNGSEMSGWIRLDDMYRGLGYAATDTYASEPMRGRAVWMWGLSRGLTGAQKPFTVAETGPFNWKFEEKNGDDIIGGWLEEAVRRGAEDYFFFRWRQSVSGEEEHPAILPWSGKKGSTYRRIGKLIADWRAKEARGGVPPLPRSGVAILHSNASDQEFLVRTRHIQFGPYEDLHILLDERLSARGIVPDYVMSADDLDLSAYRTLFVPLNCIVPVSVQTKLREFVKRGGKLVAIARMNNVDPKGGNYLTEPYPAGMTDLFAMEVNENRMTGDGKFVCDRIDPKGCAVVTRLKDGVFAGAPDLTSHREGRGVAYYKALVPRTADEMDALLDRVFGPGPERVAELRRAAERAMEPPVVDFKPAERYRQKNLAYSMSGGFAMTPKGRIWASWVGGEDGPRAFLVQHHSDDGGKTWSDTDFVVDPHSRDSGNLTVVSITSNFWCDPEGRMHFFFDQSLGLKGADHNDGRAGVWEIVSENPDAEKPVWSAPRRICDGHALNKPIVTKKGEWLLPVCHNRAGGELGFVFPELEYCHGVNLWASTDKGRTWVRRGWRHFPNVDWHEPQLVELADGRLWLLVRAWHCHNDHGILQSFSSDGGRTWSEPDYPTLNQPISRFVTMKLKSGNILYVGNGLATAWQGERNMMTAQLSRDGGRTWEGNLLLDGRARVSYPDAFQAPDGSVYVMWDHLRTRGAIQFARFTEEDVLAGRFVSPGSVDCGTVFKTGMKEL